MDYDEQEDQFDPERGKEPLKDGDLGYQTPPEDIVPAPDDDTA